MDYNCDLVAQNKSVAPVVHDNKIDTPDGKIADVCGETTAQRHLNCKDPGITVGSWPLTDDFAAPAPCRA